MHITPEMIVTIIVPALIASQGLWTLILYLVQRNDKKKDIRTRADLVILHDLVYNRTRKAIDRGYTNFYEFENTTDLYNIYSEYGGNGTGKELYEQFCKLPKTYDRIGGKKDEYEAN